MKDVSGRIIESLELNENFSSQRKRFLAAGADSQLIDAAFQQFKQLKDKGLLSLEQKDIDRYKSFEELRQVLSSLSTVKTKTQQKKEQKVAGAELVYEDDSWKVYHITTEEASKLYGKGTQWCISAEKDNRFNDYASKNTIYIAVKPGVWTKRAVTVSKNGLTNVYDMQDNVVNMTSDMPKEVFTFRGVIYMDLAKMTPMDVVIHAADVLKERWPEAEPKIAVHGEASYYYAKDVIDGRFPAGEPAIAKEAQLSLLYARVILHGRFKAGEAVLRKSAHYAVPYATEFIKGRWPEAEPYIARDPWAATYYAIDVIGGRWPEVEKMIKDHGIAGEKYAHALLPSREWPEEQA